MIKAREIQQREIKIKSVIERNEELEENKKYKIIHKINQTDGKIQ